MAKGGKPGFKPKKAERKANKRRKQKKKKKSSVEKGVDEICRLISNLKPVSADEVDEEEERSLCKLVTTTLSFDPEKNAVKKRRSQVRIGRKLGKCHSQVFLRNLGIRKCWAKLP